MTRAYETEASRKAVQAIAALLEALPLALRANVVEEAFGAALPIAWADQFKADHGADPIPMLTLPGGEIAADVTSSTGDIHTGCGGVWQSAGSYFDLCDKCGEGRA